MLVTTAIGVVGGDISAISQMARGEEVDWNKDLKAAATGAVIGDVTGLTGSAAAYLCVVVKV